jgi:hypothetical protein
MADKPKAEKKTTEKKPVDKKAAEKPTEKKPRAPKVAEPVSAEVVEAAPPPTPPAEVRVPKISTKVGKLKPKNKHRLPRKLKKAQQKAAGRL